MRPSIFNLRGYTASDPLDAVPDFKRFLLTSVVSALISIAFLHLIFNVFNIATLQYAWLFWVECAILVFLYTPIVVLLRKSSSLVLMGLLIIVAIPVDIYLQANYRDAGLPALWVYNADALLGGFPPLLQIFIVWVSDSLVAGPLMLYCSRLLAIPLWGNSEGASHLFTDEYRKLFPTGWTLEAVKKPKHDFSFYFLRLLGLGYAAYLIVILIGALGTSPWPAEIAELIQQSYENPALTIDTFIKISLMASLALIAAYNVNLRWHCAMLLLAGHLVSTAASVGFYVYNPPGTPYRDFLLISAIVDVALSGLFVYIMIRYRAYAAQFKRDKEFPVFYSLPHRLTTISFNTFGGVLALIVLATVALRLFADGSQGWGAIFGFPDPQVANSLTKHATLSLLIFLLARRESLREHLLGIVTLAYAVSVIASATWLLLGDMFADVTVNTRDGSSILIDWYFMLVVVIDGFVLLMLFALRKMFYNVEYTVSALSPSSVQNVRALNNTLFGETTDAHEAILKKVDAHVAGVQGRKRGLLNFPFWIIENILPLIYGLRPGFSLMSREECRYFLRKFILRPPAERALSYIPVIADIGYKLGTAAHALINLAYYSITKGWQDTGFIPTDARDRLQGELPTARPPFKKIAELPDGPNHPANRRPNQTDSGVTGIAPRVVTKTRSVDIPDSVDYLVIGSGAGGAVATYRLATEVADPSQILLVERGAHYSPLQDFNEHEMDMIRMLYKEGGLQQTKRFDLTVLQGECVGGTTVINNGICVKMPATVQQLWADKYDIDLSELDHEYEQIAGEIDISEISSSGINESVEKCFRDAVNGYNNTAKNKHQLAVETLEANYRNLLGDGSWNLGNKRMRKRSMLETYIPWSEARKVKILTETSAVRAHFDDASERVNAVTLRTLIGRQKKVNVRKAVIVAGGVIASSHFLMRSGITTNVGRNVSCNFAIPVAIEFPHQLDAFDGMQIALAAMDPKNRAIFETYFNPPGSFAISLPFFFQRHRDFMKKYQNLVNFGALVGSEPNGIIEVKANIMDGRALSWEIGKTDQENLKFALSTLVALAEKAGGIKAAIPMDPGLEIPLSAKNVAHFQKSLKNTDLKMQHLRLTTAHPQGGNCIIGSNSGEAHRRVVDENYRVNGLDNLFVADASLFPTGITVNPQWTVMALSSLAAKSLIKQFE